MKDAKGDPAHTKKAPESHFLHCSKVDVIYQDNKSLARRIALVGIDDPSLRSMKAPILFCLSWSSRFLSYQYWRFFEDHFD